MRLISRLVLGALAMGAATPASAHAFLDHAVPAVGGTVAAGQRELTLVFTQQVVVALSRVTLARADGGGVPAGAPSGDGASSEALHLRLGRALLPGTYTVNWRVISVDTHATSGSFRFTVAP